VERELTMNGGTDIGPKSRIPLYTVAALVLALIGICASWYTQSAKIDVIAATLDISVSQLTEAVKELKELGKGYATRRDTDALDARIKRLEGVVDERK